MATGESFGRKYGFNEIFNIRKFKEAVPISEYEDLKPFIDKLLEGEDQLLWNTPVNWFAKSSGTTSDKSKFIPITEESLEDCHYQAAKDVLALYYKFNNDKTVPLEFDIASKYQSFTFNKITVEVYENKNYIIGYYTTNDAINSTFKVKLFSMYQGYMYYEMYHIK